MSSATIYFLIHVLCISLTLVTSITQNVLLRRLKRQGTLSRRVESLLIRVEHLEVDLSQEQKNSEKLQTIVNELRSELEESKTRAFTGESDKISTVVVQKTTKIIRDDLMDIRHGLVVEKTRGQQLANSFQECKEHVIHTRNLVSSFENSIKKCKENDIKTDNVINSFGNSLRDIKTNVSQLHEDISELKTNWTSIVPTPPGPGVGEVIVGKCSLCLQASRADFSLSSFIDAACENNISYLYLVQVIKIQEESGMRKIYSKVTNSFQKGGRGRSYRSTTVVLIESINCRGCQQFAPGSDYLIFAQDILQDSTQSGSRYEFALTDRSLYTRFVVFSGRSQSLDDRRRAARLSEFLRRFRGSKWSSYCRV